MEFGRWYMWRDFYDLLQTEKPNDIGATVYRAEQYGLIELEALPTAGKLEEQRFQDGRVMRVWKPGKRYRLTKLGEAMAIDWRSSSDCSCSDESRNGAPISDARVLMSGNGWRSSPST